MDIALILIPNYTLEEEQTSADKNYKFMSIAEENHITIPPGHNFYPVVPRVGEFISMDRKGENGKLFYKTHDGVEFYVKPHGFKVKRVLYGMDCDQISPNIPWPYVVLHVESKCTVGEPKNSKIKN